METRVESILAGLRETHRCRWEHRASAQTGRGDLPGGEGRAGPGCQGVDLVAEAG